MTAFPRGSVLVRTWFRDESAWESLVLQVQTPSDDGFLANVMLVNDPGFDGLSVDELKVKQAGEAIVCFMADEMTLANTEHPILAVWVLPRRDDDRTDRRPFRVVAAELWDVENNINLANMDWEDFMRSLGDDGVFRGF